MQCQIREGLSCNLPSIDPVLWLHRILLRLPQYEHDWIEDSQPRDASRDGYSVFLFLVRQSHGVESLAIGSDAIIAHGASLPTKVAVFQILLDIGATLVRRLVTKFRIPSR